MPSTDSTPSDSGSDFGSAGVSDAPVFTRVDWENVRRRRRPDWPTTGLLIALAALAILFAYDYLVVSEELVSVLDWDVSRVDWLTILSGILLVRYGIVPLFFDPERTLRLGRRFLRRPAAVLSLVYLLVFAVVGIVGPDAAFGLEYPRLKHRWQPPVFFSVNSDQFFFFNCVGATTNGHCHGTWQYPLGTTRFGQSVLGLIAHGMRIALQLGLSAGMIMVVLATAVGTTAGYLGGRVDDLLMTYVDFQRAVPAIIVYLVLSAAVFGGFSGVIDGRLFVLILVFGLLNWGGMARLIRSNVLKQRSAGYIRAARAAGASELYVIRNHVVPKTKGIVVTSLTRRIPLLILAQIALAYLEFNRVGNKSLGRVLRYAHVGNEFSAGAAAIPWHVKWWVSVFPILFLLCTVLAFNFLGDVFRDLLEVQREAESATNE